MGGGGSEECYVKVSGACAIQGPALASAQCRAPPSWSALECALVCGERCSALVCGEPWNTPLVSVLQRRGERCDTLLSWNALGVGLCVAR